MGLFMSSGGYEPVGDGWYLARSLRTLAAEIDAAFPDATCLGTLGNTAHAAQGYASDHNPFIRGIGGVGVVRAIDIEAPDATMKQIRAHLWAMYAGSDPRMYEFGYAKGCSDNLINNWGLPFGIHVDTGDSAHLHVSVTQANGNNPSPSGYVAAIDSTAPWGFLAPAPSPADGQSHQLGGEDEMYVICVDTDGNGTGDSWWLVGGPGAGYAPLSGADAMVTLGSIQKLGISGGASAKGQSLNYATHTAWLAASRPVKA